jgi:hypothetical protein
MLAVVDNENTQHTSHTQVITVPHTHTHTNIRTHTHTHTQTRTGEGAEGLGAVCDAIVHIHVIVEDLLTSGVTLACERRVAYGLEATQDNTFR